MGAAGQRKPAPVASAPLVRSRVRSCCAEAEERVAAHEAAEAGVVVAGVEEHEAARVLLLAREAERLGGVVCDLRCRSHL